jgi:hypothetical protein
VPSSMHDLELVLVGVLYLVLAAGVLARDRGRIPRLVRDGFRTSYSELSRDP